MPERGSGAAQEGKPDHGAISPGRIFLGDPGARQRRSSSICALESNFQSPLAAPTASSASPSSSSASGMCDAAEDDSDSSPSQMSPAEEGRPPVPGLHG
ncbi:unnamed protein product [Urochloa humidicola]